jgi:hypothetical protein
LSRSSTNGFTTTIACRGQKLRSPL